MKALLNFRIVNSRVKAPSPFSAGLTFIRLGVVMIVEFMMDEVKYLAQQTADLAYWKARSRFYRAQRYLVWFWTGHYNYTMATARRVWIRTLLAFVAWVSLMGIIILL